MSISEILGKPSAILHSDGLTLYEKMKEANEDNVILSFNGISHCTTAFLNASIGKFLIENPKKASFIQFRDLGQEPHIRQKLDLVLENALNEKKRDRMNRLSRDLFHA